MKKIFLYVCAAVLCITLFPNGARAAGMWEKTTEEFGIIADEYMEKVLNEYHIAGCAVSVVKDGRLFFCKGWGYADIKNKTAVDPESTVFQIASVSKLFTATAAMQMVEQGKLSLRDDVNKYLTAFQVDNPYSEPVTLEELLTHTAGLDDRIPLYLRSNGEILYDSMEPLEDVLKKNLPPVVREPGTYCQYSVYGMALAGYLVQEASGQPVDTYITGHILKPLRMDGSSYGLIGAVLPQMARPYKYQDGAYRETAYTLISDGPSGSICATAADMSKFMLMELNGGVLDGVRILDENSINHMQAHHYPQDGRLTGYGLGFYETIRNGHRTIEHGGYLPSFSSKLTLLPEENIGMFIAINTDSPDSSRVCNEFTDLFYGYFTEHIGNTDALNAAAADIPLDIEPGKINGDYSFGAFSLRDATKFKSLFVACNIRCEASGDLVFSAEDIKWSFKYIGGGFFYDKENGNYCSVTGDDGKVILHILGGDYEKVPPVNKILFQISAAYVLMCAALSILLIIRMIRKKETWPRLVPKKVLLPLCLLMMGYYALNGIMALLAAAADTFLVIYLIMPSIATVCYGALGLTVAGSILLCRSWKICPGKLSEKAFFTAFLALSVLTHVFMYTMNGFSI